MTAMIGISVLELLVLVVLIGLGIGCWLAFSRSSNEKKDE